MPQIVALRNHANDSQVFQDSWPDIRKEVAKEMIEFRDAFTSNDEFDKFIDSAMWVPDYDKLCEELEKFAPIKKERLRKNQRKRNYLNLNKK